MDEVKTPSPQARAGEATVIFVHPSGSASAGQSHMRLTGRVRSRTPEASPVAVTLQFSSFSRVFGQGVANFAPGITYSGIGAGSVGRSYDADYLGTSSCSTVTRSPATPPAP